MNVEVAASWAIPRWPSLIVLMVSMDVKQH